MVEFLSINFFFLDFFNFCWVFPKFPFFLCHPVFECVLRETAESRLLCALRLQGNCYERSIFCRLQTESLGLLR